MHDAIQEPGQNRDGAPEISCGRLDRAGVGADGPTWRNSDATRESPSSSHPRRKRARPASRRTRGVWQAGRVSGRIDPSDRGAGPRTGRGAQATAARRGAQQQDRDPREDPVRLRQGHDQAGVVRPDERDRGGHQEEPADQEDPGRGLRELRGQREPQHEAFRRPRQVGHEVHGRSRRIEERALVEGVRRRRSDRRQLDRGRAREEPARRVLDHGAGRHQQDGPDRPGDRQGEGDRREARDGRPHRAPTRTRPSPPPEARGAAEGAAAGQGDATSGKAAP